MAGHLIKADLNATCIMLMHAADNLERGKATVISFLATCVKCVGQLKMELIVHVLLVKEYYLIQVILDSQLAKMLFMLLDR